MSLNGLYLGSINCRNLYMNDDWSMGDKEWRSIWQGRGSKAAKAEGQGSNQGQELHELQDQAQPSNAFLFYQNIEEEIEHATAAKLEIFIAMKTRPITNSVSKRAERATWKIKSIVEWIKTGRKNNRKVLEILEKRYRDHFQHEAHKKPKKKKKGGDSTVFSQWDKHLWVV